MPSASHISFLPHRKRSQGGKIVPPPRPRLLSGPWGRGHHASPSSPPLMMEALTVGSPGPRLPTGVALTFVSGAPGVKVSCGRSCEHTQRGLPQAACAKLFPQRSLAPPFLLVTLTMIMTELGRDGSVKSTAFASA